MLDPSSKWLQKAQCSNYDPEWWFPLSTPTEKNIAILLCKGCPVIKVCAQKALETTKPLVGIYAGVFFAGNRKQRVKALEQLRAVVEDGH